MEEELYALIVIDKDGGDLQWLQSTLRQMCDYFQNKNVEDVIVRYLIRHTFIRALIALSMGVGTKDTKGHYVSIRFMSDPNPKNGMTRLLPLGDCQVFMRNLDGYIRSIKLQKVAAEKEEEKERKKPQPVATTKASLDEDRSKFPWKFRVQTTPI